ncbi:Nucleotidyltransferase domain-containing protein [Candidatus Magnetomoraceae bacterium gMMP-1]
MDENIIEIAKNYAQKVVSHMPVKMIVLYGSYANGMQTPKSDIDIAVVMDKIESCYLKKSAELFNLVRSVNKKIEPVLLNAEKDKSGFLENILKHGKIIYNSSDRKNINH